MITAASMAGVPLTNGFISKEMFFTELVSSLNGSALIFSTIVATLAAFLQLVIHYAWCMAYFSMVPSVRKFPTRMRTNPLGECVFLQLYSPYFVF
jgi:multicomponent K+:H+ antiporter subunit A